MTRVSYPLCFEEKSTSYLSCNSNNDHASLNINAIFNQKVRLNLFLEQLLYSVFGQEKLMPTSIYLNIVHYYTLHFYFPNVNLIHEKLCTSVSP